MYVRLKHTHIRLCMQPCIVNFNLFDFKYAQSNIRNINLCNKFCTSSNFKFFDKIDSTLPVQDIMSPSFDILL